jgi:hypothetical protein
MGATMWYKNRYPLPATRYEKRTAGNSSLGLGQLVGLDCPDLEAFGAEPFGGSGKGRGVDDLSPDPQGVGGERLGRIDGDQARIPEAGRVHPVGIDQQPRLADFADRRFEVETAPHRHNAHFVSGRRDQVVKLLRAFAGRASGEPDKKHPSGEQDVAPVEGAGSADSLQRPKSFECGSDRFGLRPARRGARPGNHRQLLQHQRGVLDEHPVGKPGGGRKPLDDAAGFGEGREVLLVLADRPGKVNRNPLEVAQLAAADLRTRLPNQRGDQGRGVVASMLL